MMSRNKKGMSEMWWIVATAVIVVLVIIFLMIWFQSSGTKAQDTVQNQISGLGDCDCDKVADTFDDCPCDVGDPEAALDGCPANFKKGNEPDLTKKRPGKEGCTCTC